MKSSWETTRAKSNYHFDPSRADRREDVIQNLGYFPPTAEWAPALEQVIAAARPATWATRGYKGEGIEAPPDELAAEEYDLERAGYGKDYTITHLSWAVPEVLQKYVDAFALEDCMARLHIQKPGEVWNLHLDKLSKWKPDDPSRVIRIFIQLTDWQPGQFWEYGNYHWNQWRAGDVTCFDWQNMPHSTANAGHHPRVTLQITGVITEKTENYLRSLKT